eukprot:872770-Prorocentrum_minimum.AAC.2
MRKRVVSYAMRAECDAMRVVSDAIRVVSYAIGVVAAVCFRTFHRPPLSPNPRLINALACADALAVAVLREFASRVSRFR